MPISDTAKEALRVSTLPLEQKEKIAAILLKPVNTPELILRENWPTKEQLAEREDSAPLEKPAELAEYLGIDLADHTQTTVQRLILEEFLDRCKK